MWPVLLDAGWWWLTIAMMLLAANTGALWHAAESRRGSYRGRHRAGRRSRGGRAAGPDRAAPRRPALATATVTVYCPLRTAEPPPPPDRITA